MRERFLLTTWTGLLNRLAPRQGQQLFTFTDGVVPTVQVGIDEPDTARPLWGITGTTNPQAGVFSGGTLTGAVDLAVERIEMLSTNDCFFFVGTPNAAFNLLEFAATFSFPGVRPRLDFNVGPSILIQHVNTQVLQPIGYQVPFNLQWMLSVQGAPIQVFVNQLRADQVRVLEFARPGLILPAGMFLTVQTSLTNRALVVSMFYRELGAP